MKYNEHTQAIEIEFDKATVKELTELKELIKKHLDPNKALDITNKIDELMLNAYRQGYNESMALAQILIKQV